MKQELIMWKVCKPILLRLMISMGLLTLFVFALPHQNIIRGQRGRVGSKNQSEPLLKNPYNTKSKRLLDNSISAGLPAIMASQSGIKEKNRWSSSGPEGRSILGIAIDPINPATLYASIDSYGIYKSSDRGDNWYALNNGVGLPIYATSNPTIAYASASNGIVKSIDGGVNWLTLSNNGLPRNYPSSIRSLVIDPSDPNTIYAGLFFGGIYKSIDSGNNWTPVNNGLSMVQSYAVEAIVIDPNAPANIYASFEHTSLSTGGPRGGVFKSVNRGADWNLAIEVDNPRSLLLAPSKPSAIYLLSDEGPYKSSNGGISWEVISLPINKLSIDPSNPKTIYATAGDSVIYKSTDGGAGWAPVSNELLSIETLVIDPATPSIIYAGTSGGVFRSTNSGVSWTDANKGLEKARVRVVVNNPLDPLIVYSGTEGGGVYKSIDGGTNWRPTNSGLGNIYVSALAVDPSVTTTLYAGSMFYHIDVYKSTNGGASWLKTGSNIPSDIESIVIDPHDPNALYVGTCGSGVYKTTTSGLRWDHKANELSKACITALAIDPINLGTLYAGTSDGVYKSTDSGTSWKQIVIGLSNTNVTSIAINAIDSHILYVGTGNGVYKSANGGTSWGPTSTELTRAITSLVVDASAPAIIYAVTGFGIYRTTNGGINWSQFTDGLTSYNVQSLVADKTGGYLYAASSLGVNSYQYDCLYSIPPVQSLPGNDGIGSLIVTAPSGCSWRVSSRDSWLTITSGSSGSGKGTINYSVTKNPNLGTRNTTLDFAGVNYPATNLTTSISQASAQANTSTTVQSFVTPSTFGQAVTFTTNVSIVGGGTGTPTGSVTFKDGATTLTTVPLNAGTATFSTSTLSVGTHLITAAYSGDNNFAGSTSAALTQIVKANTTTTVNSSLNPSTFGQSVTFIATVSSQIAGAGTPTGTVTFLDGSLNLGTTSLANGSATFSTSSLLAGTHSITAVYSGDSNFNGNTSSPLLQSVLAADLALTKTVSPNPVLVGGQLTYTLTVTNNGPAATTSVVVTDTLPTTTTFVTCDAPGGICSGTGNNRTVSFPSLAAGASATITLTATVTQKLNDGDSISNTANVSSSVADPNPNNNMATATVRIKGVAQALLTLNGKFDFGPLTPVRTPPAAPPSDTFTVENTGNAALVLSFASLLRTGGDVDGQKITNADDRNLYSLRVLNADGSETPLGIGSTSTIAIGQKPQTFRVFYNPVMPLVADRTRGLSASQVLTDVNTSLLTINQNGGDPLKITLLGHITLTVQMISPVVLRRDGNDLVVEASAYDPNLNTKEMRFEFLDSSGRNVWLTQDIDLRAAIQASTIVKGQSFTVEQRFPGAASNTSITGVRVTAYDGDGNSTATSGTTAQTVNALATVSAASYSEFGMASEAMASAFGTGLATATTAATAQPLPTALAGTTVKIKDSMGTERLAPLFFVSPTQVNYVIPTGTAPGLAMVTITSSDGKTAMGTANIAWVAPSLFSANSNGQGVAAAAIQRVKADGTQSYEQVAAFDPTQNKYIATPINLGTASDQVYVTLFGTGIRHSSSLAAVKAQIGGVEVPVVYAGAQGGYVGLDQVNVLLPRSLLGRGEVEVKLVVDYQLTNVVKINIK